MKNGSPFQGLRTWLLCIYKNSKGGWGKAEDEKNDKDHYNKMCFEPKTIPFIKQDLGTNLL